MLRTVVEFFDITTHDGWEDEEYDIQPILCTAMGKVLREDDNLLVITSFYGPNRAAYFVVIPKGCIVTRADF